MPGLVPGIHDLIHAKNKPWMAGASPAMTQLERPLHRLHAIALDDVALAHVLIILERHAAFLARHHLARVVLEALELGQLAFVDHDVVADQADIRAPLDLAVSHTTAGDLADLG